MACWDRCAFRFELGTQLDAASFRGHDIQSVLARVAHGPSGTHLVEIGLRTVTCTAIWTADLHF